MNNYGQYLYQTYPFPFPIAMLHMGWYAGGLYHEFEADQFVSKITLELHTRLAIGKKDPEGHTCPSCAKVCKNLTCTGHCCMYEPMNGIVHSKWG